jgi:clathrin heavy chain
MKSHAMPVPVQYWRWITPNTIALVTSDAVFHWSIEGADIPRLVWQNLILFR